jgi:hypothetical protein
MLTRLPAWLCLICVTLGSFGSLFDQAHAAESLTEQDRKLDCPGVRAAIADMAVQVKRAESVVRKENVAPPTSLAQMFQSATPTAAATLVKTLRVRSKDLTALSGTKGCNRLDEMAKSRLGGAIVKPLKPLTERCDVRGELSLQDCAEDVAKWRCRGDASKGRAYLVCLDQVAERVITASGFDVTALAGYDPGCVDLAAPATCSIFVANRTGPDTKWCKRTSETAIDVCAPPKAGTPAIASVADDKKPKKAATSIADKPAVTALPPGTTCHPVPCQLGTSCNRLCSPPD